MGGTNTGLAVLNGLVGDGELAEVVANHLRLDFHGGENLAVVHADYRANHLGDDDHVPEVGLHDSGLLIGRALLLLQVSK